MSDIKYALYTSSKGFKVVGGTAAQFLKADGTLDNVSYITQSLLNSQLNNYATLNGVQTFTDINTFTKSPVIPDGVSDTHSVNLQQLKKFAPISKKRTYFLQSPVYNVGIVNRVYLPNNMVGDVTLRVNSSYHNAYAIGIIEIQFTFGVNTGGAWGFESRCTQAFGAVVERIYVEQKIYYDPNTDRTYINVHKFHAAANPMFIDVEITSHGGTELRDDSVFLQEDSSTGILNLRNTTSVDNSLDLKANKSGNNATNTWIDSSNGLQSNPLILDKMANSGGQSNLANATYGQVAGYLNLSGIAQGCPTNDWWYKFKMLHNNTAGYYGEIALQMTGGSSFRYRRVEAGGDYGWVKVWDEQNYSPFKNLIYTGDLESVSDSGIYRQEGPLSGWNYTTTLNLNSSDGRQQLTIERGGAGLKFRGTPTGSGNSGWSAWKEVYHTGNFNPASYVTQSVLNSQLANYATLNGVQTFTNTNTFQQSPVIPNGTLGSHAVNKNQIELSATQEGEGGQILGISGNNTVKLTNFYVTSRVDTLNPDDIAPNSTPNRVRFDFAKSNMAGLEATGNYAGIMTYSPWDGTTASTGDSSYQLAFANQSGINGSGIPMLKIRKGIDGSWLSKWYKVWTEADFSLSNIQQWNYAYQNGLRLNEEFTTNLGTGLVIADDYFGGDSGIVDRNQERFLAVKRNEYYIYGSRYDQFDGLNYHTERRAFGMGRDVNDADKLTVEGSVKASKNFKSEDEKPDTIFIPDGNIASLTDEIINDQYAVRLDPHEYYVPGGSALKVDDRNRLIHIIGQDVKMAVDFTKIYPKQQIVIYNFDQSGANMPVMIMGKQIASIPASCFIRLYVTKPLRVILEKEQSCKYL